MAKYIKAKGRKPRSHSTDALRNQLLRDLESEGKKILKSLTSQFTQDLQNEGGKLLQNLVGQSTGGAGGVPFSASSVTNLLSSAVGYVLNKPRTSTHTKESARSREAEERFRVSRSQTLAEAQNEIAKGNKNL